MPFGQQSGPPASAKQVDYLKALVQKAGHADFRDARGPLSLTQRQAAGKFTRQEASALIEQLLAGPDADTPPEPAPSAPRQRNVRWGEFAAERPDLAAEGRALLFGHDVGLGFLATTRPDTGPRVHPICPLHRDEGLYAFIVPGPKLNDLRRDGRYALHCETFPPPQHDDAFYLTGMVTEPSDAPLRATLTAQFLAERKLDEPWPGFDAQALIEFRIATCLLTLTETRNGLPAGHTVWRAGS
jgi:hypothetical protein